MIQKLTRRMILLVLAGLLLASSGLVIAINWMNGQSLTRQAEAVLDMLAQNGGNRPTLMNHFGERNGFRGEPLEFQTDSFTPNRAFRDRGFNPTNAAILSNFYTALLDDDGNVTEWSSERRDLYTDKDIQAMAAAAAASGKETGRVDTAFFRLVEQDGQKMLIVIDRSLEIENARNVLKTTALVAVIEDALLSLGAVWLIRRMVKPVDEAMEKQKQFVWDASHELKTPLAVISANAEALGAEMGGSKPLEYIQSEVQRTDRLIQNLLTLARMEKGDAQIQRASFDLSRALLQVALPFESAVFEAGKTMEMDIPEGISYSGDQDRIKQLAVILLSNAEKYSDAGGIVRVSLEAKGEKRILKVFNTGPAIPEAAQEKIFDRFYRVDSSHNREVEGNGLGLAIAQSIVAAHKGKISVRSVEGEGTTFTVNL